MRLAVGSSHGLAVGDKIILHRGGSDHVANWDSTYNGLHTIKAVASTTVDLETAYVNAITSTYVNTNSCQNNGPYYHKVYDATDGPEYSTNTAAQYQDWQDKGGSFIIIDFSKFFNMNTYANGRVIGKMSGGRTDLGDYVSEKKDSPN